MVKDIFIEGADTATENGVLTLTGFSGGQPIFTPRRLAAKLVTTANPSDVVAIPGVTANSVVSLTPTNASAAADAAYAVAGNGQVTVFHASTAGETFDVVCL